MNATTLAKAVVAINLVLAVPQLAVAETSPNSETTAEESGVATELGEESESAESTESDDSIGLNLDLGYASAYAFRGLNVFQEDSQLDQNMLLGLTLAWAAFDTGLWVAYWAGFQISGSNISDNIDAGIGAEQDLLVGYDLALGEAVTFSLGMAYYFYPAADEAVAGCTVPSYLEPSIGISIAAGVDIGLKLSYFAGVQEVLSDYRYLYLNPTIGKTFQLHEMVGLSLELGYGFKFFHPDSSVDQNLHDVLFKLGVPISLPRGFYIVPSFGMAWTDIDPSPTQSQTTTYVPTAGAEGKTSSTTENDEFIFWGGLNVGVNL